MSVLLVGCGYWGRNWAKTLYAMGELGAICEPAFELQAQLKNQYPDVPLYSHLAEALEHTGIEACLIATPVITHRHLARQCMLAGKHALVEKPLTLEATEAEELVLLAKNEGLVLAVGHLLMYHPALLALRNIIHAGELGEILAVHCTRVNLGKVRNEENAWWSLAPHDLSVISMLLGESFEPVSAIGMTPLGRPEIADGVYAVFETASGKSASVHVSWMSPNKRHETVVIGTRQIAVFEDTRPPGQKLSLTPYVLEREGGRMGDIHRQEPIFVDYQIPRDDLLTLEAKAFLAACRGQADELRNDGANGLQVVRMLSQVQQLLSRKIPVWASPIV